METNEILWKKWPTFCLLDGIDPLSVDESSILGYMGWLFDEGKTAGYSLRNYFSAVTSPHTRIGKPFSLTPLISLAVSAFQQASTERKMLQDPKSKFEQRALPRSVTRLILNSAIAYPDSDLTSIRNASATSFGYIFFECGEAGASRQLNIITGSRQSINIAISLRKNQARVSYTLTNKLNTSFTNSLIALLLRYDRLRRNIQASSPNYWPIPGVRFTASARSATAWLQDCLYYINIYPPPQVIWSLNSLRMGEASESAAIGVQEYIILIWSDWSNSRTLRESSLDGRVKQCEESFFVLGHLL